MSTVVSLERLTRFYGRTRGALAERVGIVREATSCSSTPSRLCAPVPHPRRGPEETGAHLIALGVVAGDRLGTGSRSARGARARADTSAACAGPRDPDRRRSKGGIREQIAIVARLKDDAKPRAAELIANEPPFDPRESGLARHTVYLSADEVVFVFEGTEVEWVLDRLVDEPFHWPVIEALDEWRALLEGNPRIARPVYSWSVDVLDGAAAGR